MGRGVLETIFVIVSRNRKKHNLSDWSNNHLAGGYEHQNPGAGCKRQMEWLAGVSCPSLTVPRWRRFLQAPIRLAGWNPPRYARARSALEH